MSANTMLCDGDCGNVYYEIDLNETFCKQMMCKECMFIFLSENEASQEHSQ